MDHTPRVPGFDHRRASAHDLRRTLRSLLASGDPVVMPGCTDALGARLIEQAGFGVAYATGAGLANAQFGLPDIGLISQSEVVDHLGRLTAAVDIPIVVDADTGYGGPIAAMRTVSLFERAGASGIQLEDQEMPKRCGHFDDHSLIPADAPDRRGAAAGRPGARGHAPAGQRRRGRPHSAALDFRVRRPRLQPRALRELPDAGDAPRGP